MSLASSVAAVGLLPVFSRVAPRVVSPVRSPRRAVWWWRLLHRRECPAVSGEFARDGDDDDRAGLASGLECVPASVQPPTAAFSLGLHSERLAVSSAFERDARDGGGRWCQAASISSRRTWLLPALVIAPWRRRSPLEFSLGVRPRNGPSELGPEPVPVAELDRQRERRQRRDATETNEPTDDIDIRRRRGELG